MALQTGPSQHRGTPVVNANRVRRMLQEQVLPYVPPELHGPILSLSPDVLVALTEIRLRRKRALVVSIGGRQRFLAHDGTLAENSGAGLLISSELFDRAVELVTQGSLYALQTELRNGFITLPGGHRVGIVGTALVESDHVRGLKHFGGLNVRIARELRGVAGPLMPVIWPSAETRPPNTLLYSGPGAGKTTLLRDIVRHLSLGDSQRPALAVGLVDERSELAACYRGVPSHDVGPNTDVLDACPKADGMRMLLRSMGPQVLVTDELGRPEDALAVRDAVASGVTVVTTAHASSLDELRRRPVLAGLLDSGVFERFVQLSAVPRPGTVAAMHDVRGRELRV